MIIKDILDLLEKWAPPVYQESYDNSGLLVGNKQNTVTGVLVSLDCTEDVVDEAVQKNCNLVVSHHPIVFSGLKSITGKNYIERTVIKAIKNDIALYAIHTNLDHVHNGVNQKIAEKLELENVRILSPKQNTLSKYVVYTPNKDAEKVRMAVFAAGGGHVGEYAACSFNSEGIGTFKASEKSNPHVGKRGQIHFEEETRIEFVVPTFMIDKIHKAVLSVHPYEEVAYDIYAMSNKNQQIGSGMLGELKKALQYKDFLHSLKLSMNTACVRYTKLNKEVVKRVAVCGGAGSFLLKEAMQAEADVLVTSDFKYHQFFDGEGKIGIADIGHYESEQFTKDLIADFLSENFSTFAVRLSEVNTNPVHYI
jgi:dinuclear metal center YbgI/SA1388 family protein